MDLQSVLSFMYVGEVNVGQQDLTAFLAVAEDLQVKGGGNAAYWQCCGAVVPFRSAPAPGVKVAFKIRFYTPQNKP